MIDTNTKRLSLLIFFTSISYYKLLSGWYYNSSDWSFLYTWDDDTNYRDNGNYKVPLVRFLTSSNAFQIHINVWEPASWLLKCIVWNIAGPSSLSFRMCSFVLHLSTSMTLYWMLNRIIRIQFQLKENNRTQNAAFIGSLWYALHPLNVEVVCWPSALPYVLSGFFQVAALYFYTFVIEGDNAQDHSNDDDDACFSKVLSGFFRVFNNKNYCITVIFVILSICSKSAALLAAPAGILAFDMLRHHNDIPIITNNPIRWLQYAIKSHICVGFSVLVLLAVTIWANVGGMENDIDLTTITQEQRLIKAPMLIFKCIQDSLFPLNLRAHVHLHFDMLDPTKHSLPIISFALLPMFWMCMMSLYDGSSAGNIWFLVTLLPTLGIIQHGYVCFGADRLWHYALVPLSAAVSIFFLKAYTKERATSSSSEGQTKSLPVEQQKLKPTMFKISFVAASLLLGFSYTTSLNITNWMNDENVWLSNLKVDPSDWRARDQLIEHYVGKKKFDKARPHLAILEIFSPGGGLKAELHKAKLLLMQGLTDDACSLYSNLMTSGDPSYHESPARGSIYNNNGVCSLHRNNLDAALVYFEQGLASTTYERHLATLNYNHQELIRSMKIMKKDPNNNMKTYQGNHSFLF